MAARASDVIVLKQIDRFEGVVDAVSGHDLEGHLPDPPRIVFEAGAHRTIRRAAPGVQESAQGPRSLLVT